jgi:hypothetical protein
MFVPLQHADSAALAAAAVVCREWKMSYTCKEVSGKERSSILQRRKSITIMKDRFCRKAGHKNETMHMGKILKVAKVLVIILLLSMVLHASGNKQHEKSTKLSPVSITQFDGFMPHVLMFH